MDVANGRDEIRSHRILQQIAGGAGAHRVKQRALVAENRDHHHFGLRAMLTRCADDLQAAGIRQPQVDQHDVGPVLKQCGDAFAHAAHASAPVHVGRDIDGFPEVLQMVQVVFDRENGNHPRMMMARRSAPAAHAAVAAQNYRMGRGMDSRRLGATSKATSNAV